MWTPRNTTRALVCQPLDLSITFIFNLVLQQDLVLSAKKLAFGAEKKNFVFE